MRAAIYIRISKDREGAGIGVARQERDCRELAERLGWTVASIFSDNDMSAYSGKPRKKYLSMLDAIRAGQADAVLAWHTDRLHRSPAELETYIQACEPRQVPTHCVKAGELDLTTPSGRLVARQLGAVARYESEHMAERIQAKQRDLALQGKFRGGPRPFGFEPDGVTHRPDEAARIAEATREILAGASVAGTCRKWNEEGVRPPISKRWTPAAVRSVLVRARNAGLSEHLGEIVGQAVWEPIVSENQWRSLRALLDDLSRRPKGNLSLRWQGSNFYLCGVCGAEEAAVTMRSNSTWASHTKELRPAYRCREYTHNTILAVPTDAYVDKVAAEVLRRRGASLLATDDGGVFERLQADLTALQGRSDELAGLYATGEIKARQWTLADKKIAEQMEQLRAQLAGHTAGSALAGVADARDPGAAYLASPVERRRPILHALMTVMILPGRRGLQSAGMVDIDRIQITPR